VFSYQAVDQVAIGPGFTVGRGFKIG
jgi:hypothetical protein